MQAIILAGGKGSRLRPFTTYIPKPLVPLGEMPILEIVLKQLKHFGVTDVVLAVNHLAEIIRAFFQNGEKLGLNITYSSEDKPLGTAGPLSLIEKLDDNFLVMNGDILTTLNFAQMYQFHLENKSDLTIAIYKKEVKIDLGVLEIKNNTFQNYIEKPTYYFDVSMGIYFMNKRLIELIPKNIKYDLPELVIKAHQNKKIVKCYSGDYYWLDIGRVDDYENAQEIFEKRKAEFLPK